MSVMKNLVLERLCWGWYSGWWGGLELVVNSNPDDGSDNDVYRTVDVDWLEVLKRNGGFVLPESKNKNMNKNNTLPISRTFNILR